jgi:hypothetical protein
MPVYPNEVLDQLIELLKLDEDLAKKCYRITITLTVGGLVQINYETHEGN